MTTDRLQAIKARAAAATEGPWEATYEEADQWTSITGQGRALGDGLWMVRPEVATCEGEPGPDAEFISHSRADVDWLVQRLDAVTALLDQWEREAGPDSNAWAVYGPQKLSTPFAVNQLRAALNRDPDAMSMAEAQRRIDSGEITVWCWCWGTPQPDGRWIYPNETCADVCHNERRPR